jgi:hypothetical protein
VNYQGRNNNTQSAFNFAPQQFVFRKTAEITGIICWGATTSLEMVQGTDSASSVLIPDQGADGYGQIYGLSPAGMQTVKSQGNRSKILNAYLYQLLAANSSTNNISYISHNTPFICYDEFRCRDFVITAPAIPFYNIGSNNDQPIFEIRDNGKLRLNGLFLIGNNNLDETGYSNQGAVNTPLFRNENQYKHFGFAPCLISVGNQSADSVCSVQFCGWGSRIVIGANNSIYNTTFFNFHLMTYDYNYMDSNDQGDRGVASEEDDKQGPAFNSLFGRLSIKRRLLRNHFVDYRTANNAARSGFAGGFGRFQRAYGSVTQGWRYMSVTVSNSQYQVDGAGSGGTTASTPAGSIFEYLDRNTPLRRNGVGNPGITEPTPDEPEILGDNYDWSASQIQLNIKYMKAKPGLDYDNNIQSNRTLYA